MAHWSLPFVMLAFAACDQSTRGNGVASPPAVRGAQAAGATCSQIIECIGGCAEATCRDACIARGTPEAQAGVYAIERCAASAACADSDCMGARCGAELAACASGASVAASTDVPGQAAPGGGAGQGAVVPGPAASDEQFMFRRSDGLEMASPLTLVSRGRAVAMNGVWKDSLHGVTLEISGATYKLTYEASFTTADSMGRPSGGGGVAQTETGSWQLDGQAMVLSPSGVQGAAANANDRYVEPTTSGAEPARRWAIEGLMMSYQRWDDQSVHPVEGLAIAGPAPRWAYSPDGTWSFTLRRAR